MKNEKLIVNISPPKGGWGVFLLLILLASCGNDASDIYPNVVTEFAMVLTDDAGRLSKLITDDETTYIIANQLEGYDKDTCYRAVCGFVPDGRKATLHNATGAYLLRDSTLLPHQPDSLKVVSVWQSGHFINMQLSPLTQGGVQYWGYRCDSVRSKMYHLSLHHRQNGDPLSYTQTVYASLPIDSLKSIAPGDSFALHIATFQGDRVWKFKKMTP